MLFKQLRKIDHNLPGFFALLHLSSQVFVSSISWVVNTLLSWKSYDESDDGGGGGSGDKNSCSL